MLVIDMEIISMSQFFHPIINKVPSRKKCLFTANGETKEYKQGDTYFIPADLKHQITLCAGYSEVDYVDDPNDGE